MSKWITTCAAVAFALMATTAGANEYEAQLRAQAAAMNAWLNDAVVIAAIKEQNERHASLSQTEIDRLDKQWRAETKATAQPLISAVLSTSLSAYLKKVKAESQGLYTEIFVMDNKGLNVGQSDMTSDYWQGDEAKWQKTFLAGPPAVLIGKIKQDESTQMFQSQVSKSITDPATNTVIGAVTVGIDVDQL